MDGVGYLYDVGDADHPGDAGDVGDTFALPLALLSPKNRKIISQHDESIDNRCIAKHSLQVRGMVLGIACSSYLSLHNNRHGSGILAHLALRISAIQRSTFNYSTLCKINVLLSYLSQR